jgi:hypothetical protein
MPILATTLLKSWLCSMTTEMINTATDMSRNSVVCGVTCS